MAVAAGIDWREEARLTAKRHGLDPEIFQRLVGTESAFNPSAVSPKGATGLGQLMPGTARELGVDAKDPKANLEGSARYLKAQLDRFGDYSLALAAYNAGPENVQKHGGIPPFPETRQYVAKIMRKGGTVEDLGRAVKKKYPVYRNIPDAELGRKVKAKYPAYSYFEDIPDTTVAGGEPSAEADPSQQPPTQPGETPATTIPSSIRPVPSHATAGERAASLDASTATAMRIKGASDARRAAAEAERLAFEKERYESLPLPQRALLRFASGAAGALPSLREAPEPDRYPAGTGPVERAAELAGGVAGFGAVAIPVGIATGGAGAPPLVAGALGAGVAAAAGPGTAKERGIRGGTSALAAYGGGALGNVVASQVSRQLSKAAPQLARALEQEFRANLAKGMPVEQAQRIVQEKIARATEIGIRRAQAIVEGGRSVSGAAAFGVGQPLAEYGALRATGEDVEPPKAEDLVQSGLELLALNIVLGGKRLAKGATARGVRAGFTPAGLEHVSPSPAEAAAARANVTPPGGMKPGMQQASSQATSALTRTISEIQNKAQGGIKFNGGGLSIDDAYIVPNLVRVFPGDPKAVRVTVVDNETGRIHSVALPSISALQKAIGYTPPKPKEIPLTVSREPGGFVLPPFTKLTRAVPASPEKGKGKGKKAAAPPPAEVPVPPGRMVSKSQFEEAKRAGISAAAQRAETARIEAQRREEAAERARVDVRTQALEKAIAKLENQIAERPGDKQVKRWRRRLSKLQSQLKVEQKAAKAAAKAAKAAPKPPNVIVATLSPEAEARIAKSRGTGGGPTSFGVERGDRRATPLGSAPEEGERRKGPRREDDKKELEGIRDEGLRRLREIDQARTMEELVAVYKRQHPGVVPKPGMSEAAIREELQREATTLVKSAEDLLGTGRGQIPPEGKTAPPVREFRRRTDKGGVEEREGFREKLKKEVQKLEQQRGAEERARQTPGEKVAKAEAGEVKPTPPTEVTGRPGFVAGGGSEAPAPAAKKRAKRIKPGELMKRGWLKIQRLKEIDARIEDAKKRGDTARVIELTEMRRAVEAGKKLPPPKPPEPPEAPPKPAPKPKPKPPAPPAGKPKATPPKRVEPAPMPKRTKGVLERGDVVSGSKGTRAFGSDIGFVLKVEGTPPYASVTVRWSHGVTAVESQKNLKLKPGLIRATEEQLKRIEAVEDKPTPAAYQPGVKAPEPPPRQEIENEVFRELRRSGGFRPLDEMSFKPKSSFNIAGNRAWWTEEWITDGHLLFFTPKVVDPKVSAMLKDSAAGTEAAAPSAEGVKQVVAGAQKGKMVKLDVLGWLPPRADYHDMVPVAFLHDPKTGRIVGVDPQKLKLVQKAVAPDSYEQGGSDLKKKVSGKHVTTDATNRPIVLKRDGELVGILMPVRIEESMYSEVEEMLGLKGPEGEAHGDILAGARRFAKPKAKAKAKAKAKPRGIPIATQAPRVPTEAEAAGLPTTPLPSQAGSRVGIPQTSIDRFKEAMREIVAIANPVALARGPNLDLLMRHKGEIKRALFRTEQAQKSLHRFWEKRSKAQVLDFLVKFESGSQADQRLEAIAESYRQRADNMFEAISRYRALPYWENWFPHIWKDPRKAQVFFASRRPLEGNKRFLKKRFFADTLAGLKAGLEPMTWNLEDLMQAAEHNARKYVMVQEMKNEAKSIGSAKFVPLGKKPPKGMRPPDQNWASVYLNPETAVPEYFDKRVMDQLQAVARRIGVRHTRKMKLRGGALGLSYTGSPNIETKFATPLSTLAHEIGHQIDDRYGLQAIFVKPPVAKGKGAGQINKERIQVKRELQALADLRWEGQQVSPYFKHYVRKSAEKMAVMLEALIHAPEEFKRVAPLTYKRFTEFLASKPELKPLLDIKPGLVKDTAYGIVRAPGAVLGGRWYFQEDLARILDHHMSKDFITQTAIGRSVMDSRNTLNAINLGVSAFHFTGTTLLAMMSRMGVGISELVHGRPITALGKILTTPAAPFIYANFGYRFFGGDPALDAFERRLFAGGASLESKQYYKNQMLDRFVRNARQTVARGATPYERIGGATKAMAQAPFAILELAMRLMTNYYIPQMKVGAFMDLEASQLRIKAKDIAAGKDSETNVARIAWRDIEDRLGLLNYDNEFWHNTLKSALMVLIRAPGWTLGTLRALGGAAFIDFPRFASRSVTDTFRKPGANVKPRGGTGWVNEAPEWTSRMSFAFGMVFVTMLAGAVYQFLRTGDWPKTLEDYLHPKNGLKDRTGAPQRVSFPTYMKDVDGWSRDPIKSLLGRIDRGRGTSSLGHGGKLAPEVTIVLDLLENQSYRGPIRNVNDPWYDQAGQVIRYIFGREQPFAISGARRIAKEGGDPGQVAESFIGITPYYPPRERRERFRYREVEQ